MLEPPFDRIPPPTLFCRSETSDDSEFFETKPKAREVEGAGAEDDAGNCDCWS